MSANAFQLDKLRPHVCFILLEEAFPHQVHLGSIVNKTLGDVYLAIDRLDVDLADELALFATTGIFHNQCKVEEAGGASQASPTPSIHSPS